MNGNLQKKQVFVPISCATCGNEWENSWHLFIYCPMAKACWEELGTWNKMLSLSNEADGFVQWLFKLFQTLDVSTLENIAMVLWGIWRTRNEKLWNKMVKPAEIVVSSALQLLMDWRANGSRNIGVGMVLRDSDGVFISAKTNVFVGRVGIKDAEAMAFKEALSWVEGMNVQDVIF
ncbi:uncharacterized protein LOC142525940 [Primulina tabacum]|uniref:uncharacterized protein LOC142525940 n=1 Tax=Primulina tabacum TaxID=48773 RepID=UPI003F5A5E92